MKLNSHEAWEQARRAVFANGRLKPTDRLVLLCLIEGSGGRQGACPYKTKDVAMFCGMTWAGTQRTLVRLQEAGIVSRPDWNPRRPRTFVDVDGLLTR